MSRFFQALCRAGGARAGGPGVQEADVQRWGLTGIKLRPYQLEGVNWLVQCYEVQHGCILGDEMGLGKTCQAISLLLYLTKKLSNKERFLILCPLSVLSNWKEELERFAPGLSFITYVGSKEERPKLQENLKGDSHFHALLTTYEICLKDAAFLKSFNWAALVVDEAHRLKNQNSLLYKTLSEFSIGFSLLLTGTPVQNSLQELYSLLSLIEPDIFPQEQVKEFVEYYQVIEKESEPAKELHSLLQPFLLRRVKSEVAAELPKKVEVVLYHGMSALQKKYYKAILTKDLDAFENETGRKVTLQNVLIQLRKCVAHPYLFNGVEPEPFEIGDHIVEASGKMCLLDKLLSFLYAGGHRVLLFSQMTQLLDILQDYMDYRGYSYERLDGSVRGEERHLAIKNFGQQPIFIFLLSTRAGGVGMNLTAADTVIFTDSDFNPQNDLQAIARAHRIGQHKPVKIIRLIGRDTVEEIIYRRAASKLRLTNVIVEGGQFALGAPKPQGTAELQLSEILKFGLDKLFSSEGSTVQDVELENILGETKGGQWIMDTVLPQKEENEEEDTENHMYVYEGKDYSKEPSREDKKAFDHLLDLQKALIEETSKEGRALRNKANALLTGLREQSARRKHLLSEEELEARRKKRQEAAAKRARLMEEKKAAKAEAEHKKKYDDSGRWGRGGLFTALEARSDQPRKIYEMAGKMKDLELGGTLLFPIDDKKSRKKGQDLLALIVAQHRDRSNNLSGIKLSALEKGLKKIYLAAKKRNATVHLPRIGYATKGFNWYGTERLIRKHLATRGVPTLIYYFSGNKGSSSASQPYSSSTTVSKP
ncbi:chromodomain-helicase-DNA-binding protein 1-like isoform X2 [Vidua macroura]|uniref:chromodomain-helicase-DNA-binding protein 1-like isoform X2 n=1 Tax=Vidua macroura TaxID=187451 RepID=UPI0023A86DD6|nr:chromodomain-helicase-DNA-binding protein 1-like isoform X2 [Vidua macroura]